MEEEEKLAQGEEFIPEENSDLNTRFPEDEFDLMIEDSSIVKRETIHDHFDKN